MSVVRPPPMFSCLHKLPQTASCPLCRLSSRTQHDGGCNKERSEANGNQEIASKPLHPVASHLRSSGSSGQGFPQYCSLRRTIFFLLENLSSQEQDVLQLPHSPSLQSTEKQRAFYLELSINRTSSPSHAYLDKVLCCIHISPQALLDMDALRFFAPV